MPRKLVSTRIKNEFKKLTQRLVMDLSQELTIVQESPLFVDCPNCVWDSINKKSSNIFDATFTAPVTVFAMTDQSRTISPVSFTGGRCPVCIGEGQLFTSEELCIPAMVNFYSPDDDRRGGFVQMAAGKEGKNGLLIKTLACHYELLLNNEIFKVHNGIKCEKFTPPILRGLGGEEAITECVMLTVEVGQRTSEKFRTSTDPRDDPRRRIKGPTDLSILRGIRTGRDS
jgi:hypothetical protein